MVIVSLQTAELLQVYGGQMDMIFSVHVNGGRVSIVNGFYTGGFAVICDLRSKAIPQPFEKRQIYGRSCGFSNLVLL